MLETQKTKRTGSTHSWRVVFILGLALALTGSALPPKSTLKDVVGVNDFRISDMGTNGTTGPTAVESAVAYNPEDEEYLVLWRGDDFGGGSFAIYGQLLDATSGAEVGVNDFQVSDLDPSVGEVAVACNIVTNEYLAVWVREDAGQRRVFGQRLDAAGAELGSDFQISENLGGDAAAPAVVSNGTGDYLVVWSAEVDGVAGELEIFGEILDVTGTPVLETFRISDVGPDSDPAYDALEPAVAWRSAQGEYLVVWSGDDDGGALVDDELEIFGQRLDAAGSETGANDFRISDMGPDGDPGYNALEPALAYNEIHDDYLVVWRGDDDTPPLVDGEFEIFGQRLDGDGALLGANDFRISDMGPDGTAAFFDPGRSPAVAYSSGNNEYLVAWSGTDEPLVSGEQEIYMQRLEGGESMPFAPIHELGPNDFRISDMGPDGNVGFLAERPAVAFATGTDEFLLVWRGDDDTPPLVDGEFEILGQRFEIPAQILSLGATPFAEGENPEVAFDPTSIEGIGGEFRIWQGVAEGEVVLDIFGAFFDSAGNPIGQEFQINTYTTGHQTQPHLAYDNLADDFLVVWQGAPDQDGDGDGIAGQFLDANTGQLLGTELQINTFTTGDQTEPRVSFDRAAKEFMVVWTDVGRDGAGEIIGQRFSFLNPVNTEFQINDFTTGEQSRPSLAFDDDQAEFLIVWQSEGNDGDDFGIGGNYFREGTPQDTEFQVNIAATTGPQIDPDVAFETSARSFLVVWRDDGGNQIPGQRFRGGKRLGTEFQIGTPGSPRVASDPDPAGRTFLVVWDRPSEQGAEIVGRSVYADPDDGNLASDEFEVSAGPVDTSPAIAVSGTGIVSVVWESAPPRGSLPVLLQETFEIATDLNLRVADAPDPVPQGGLLTYTITAINDGPGDASDVYVETMLPADLTPVATSGCLEDPNGVPMCTFGVLGRDPKVFTIDATVDVGFAGPLSATFTIKPATTPPDSDLSGNTVGAVTSSSVIFNDGFESGNCSQWATAVPSCN